MIKLLIVDDEKLSREILMKYIPWKDLGIYAIQEAVNGVEALEIALHMHPDIVLCDIKMPKMNGIELAKHLKEKVPDCKIVFLSVYSDKDYLKSAIQLNAVDYVEKPINIEEVKTAVARAVAIVINEKKKRWETSPSGTNLQNTISTGQTLALDLVENEMHDADFEKIALQRNRLPAKGNYNTIILKLNHPYDDKLEDKNQRIDYILHTLEEVLGIESPNYISGVKNDEYVILHFFNDEAANDSVIKNLMEDFSGKIKKSQQIKCTVFIGVGERVEGIKNIRKSYQTALISIQRQFYYDYNKVIFYTESKSKPYNFDDNISNAIITCIKERKKNETIILIRRLTNEIRQHDNTIINYIKNCYYTILLKIYKFVEEMNIHIYDNGDNKKFLWEIISTSYILNEIEEYLIKLITSIFEYLESEACKNNISAKITKYIQENMGDTNLSIKSIAECLYLTPAYLCLVFKKETGKTINQYITEIRIEKAKEYLRDKRIKRCEVSRKVGYNNSKYFTKVFKKEAGLTPSEFMDKEQQ